MGYLGVLAAKSVNPCFFICKENFCGTTMTNPIEKPKVGYFDHDKWDVYQASLELVILISDVVEHLPRGKAYLADQLQRAGTSVPLNIAEGAGEDSLSEKARFYRMAKRSATECASILDVCQRLKLIEEHRYIEGRKLLLRIVAMLTKMGRAETAYVGSN
jgi:four helix bundle protein